MFENFDYLHRENYGNNQVSFRTSEGEGIEVNKYFLFLYDEFYRNIIEEKIEEQLVFIFDGYSFEELKQLRKTVVLKHFKCRDTCQNSNNDQASKEKVSQHDDTGIVNIKSNNQPVLTEEKVSEYKDVCENIVLECPFKCEHNPELDWTVDTLYAHIFCSHSNEVKSNIFVSIEAYLTKLKSKISNKCALNCDESKKKNAPYFDLKTHYYRCHVEEQELRVCDNCGQTFRNLIALKHHVYFCKQSKECSICGDGKKHKHLRDHIYYVHKPREIKCPEEKCSKTFRKNDELQRHIRTVHRKEKNFVCDKCDTRMSKFANLSDHRLKIHGKKFSSFNEYKQMITSGKHPSLSPEAVIPSSNG